MRTMLVGIAVGAAVLSIPVAARAADDPVVLTPSTQWNVDFAPNKCRLARAFGEGEDRHFLFFEQYYPNEKAGLTLAGPALSRFRSLAPTILSFYEGHEGHRTEPFAGDMENFGKALIYSNVDLAEEAGEDDDDANATGVAQLDTEFGERIEFVSVEQRGRTVKFQTGPLGEAFEVLNTCTQDMIRDWGLDVEQHLGATRRPQWKNKLSLARRLQRQYPAAALRQGEQAILRMRVIVDTDGKVERCQIDAATTNELDSPACREMENAEFEPALDAEGQPFRSYYATSIIYRIGR